MGYECDHRFGFVGSWGNDHFGGGYGDDNLHYNQDRELMNGQHLFSKYLKFIKNVPFWDFFSDLLIFQKKSFLPESTES